MDLSPVEQIANAVLYEGYMLYPYRGSSVKNKRRFNWGALAPKSYSDAQKGTEAWEMQTQCLFVRRTNVRLDIRVRFLHLTSREIGKVEPPTKEIPKAFETVESLEIAGRLYQAWEEAVERTVDLSILDPDGPPKTLSFFYPGSKEVEAIKDNNGMIAGLIVRRRADVSGQIEAGIEKCPGDGLSKLTLRIRNTTAFEMPNVTREAAMLNSLVSTHVILNINGGEFVSLLEPPENFADAVATCDNRGAFPILVGSNGERNCMLASPIILYDYPEIAPESPGDLFDSTEIDEILTLRIMTMTDEEKREMRAVDDRARKILERTESMSADDLLRMHGTLRGMERSKQANG